MKEEKQFIPELAKLLDDPETAVSRAAYGALKALTDDGLFIGQSKAFFTFMHDLAAAADAARPGG